MRFKKFFILLCFTFLSHTIIAESQNIEIEVKRKQTVTNFLSAFSKKDVNGMNALFSVNATVTTAAGTVPLYQFFSSFYPQDIQWMGAELKQMYPTENNHYLVIYLFTSKQPFDGVRKGEYVTEFVFMDNSENLQSIYMHSLPQFAPGA